MAKQKSVEVIKKRRNRKSKPLFTPGQRIDETIDWYLKTLTKHGKMRKLTEAETHDLCLRKYNGDKEARDELILHNIPLVVYKAKKMRSMFPKATMAELISAGTEGLIAGIGHIDGRDSYKIASYIALWIEERIRYVAVENCTHLYAPRRVHDLVRKFVWQRRRAEKTSEAFVDDSPLSDDVKRIVDRLLHDPRDIHECVVSDNGGDPVCLADLLRDDSAELPFSHSQFFDIEGTIKDAGIEEEDARFIRMRFGIGAATPMMIKEISVCSQKSSTYISLSLAKSLERLREFLGADFGRAL